MHDAMVGRQILITQSAEFMGRELCAVFAAQGATMAGDGFLGQVFAVCGDWAARQQHRPTLRSD